MKKFKKGLLYTVIAVVLIIVIAVSYVTLALPNVGPPEDIHIAITPQRVARGNYLVNDVNLCMDCHSRHDWSKPIGRTAPENFGTGGDIFDAGDGFPGKVQAPNITPYNLKGWTDGEVFRAITTGERKDGSAIFPMMPWGNYAKMDREDLYSIIAYLRTIKPVATPVYLKRQLDFPLGILVHLMPQKAALGQLPPESDTVRYGAYIINAAGCDGCHSQRKSGDIIPGMNYAGGKVFKLGAKTLLSANITPDKATGIGNWTEQGFVQQFKSHADPSVKHPLSAMPWFDYSSMKESDLKAIYAYLKSIKPVNNKVVNW